jgi:hypothetical protein
MEKDADLQISRSTPSNTEVQMNGCVTRDGRVFSMKIEVVLNHEAVQDLLEWAEPRRMYSRGPIPDKYGALRALQVGSLCSYFEDRIGRNESLLCYFTTHGRERPWLRMERLYRILVLFETKTFAIMANDVGFKSIEVHWL